jgi:hypothetical protein
VSATPSPERVEAAARAIYGVECIRAAVEDGHARIKSWDEAVAEFGSARMDEWRRAAIAALAAADAVDEVRVAATDLLRHLTADCDERASDGLCTTHDLLQRPVDAPCPVSALREALATQEGQDDG